MRERLHDGVGVAAHHGEVGELGLGVEVVERGVEIAHGGAEPDEDRDARRHEDGGEDEAEPVTGLVSQSRARVPG